MSIYDVSPEKLIKKTAEELKKVESIKPPVWANYVKTSTHKERPPFERDWWYVRSASILRKIYILGPIGVQKLRTKYGGLKDRGHKPEHFYKGSGNIIRKMLQQLEKAGYIQHTTKKGHYGRIITPKGKKLLDSVSKNA